MANDRNKPPLDRPPAQLVNLARALLMKAGTLESTTAGERLDRFDLQKALEEHLRSNAGVIEADAAPALGAAAAEAVENAERALERVAGGASASSLTELEYASLEAIVQVTGRPALRYKNGGLETPPGNSGDNVHWIVLIATWRSKIMAASASVGRISLGSGNSIPEGTGWRLGADLIVTNRHVLSSFVENPNDAAAAWRIDHSKHPAIDFAANGRAPSGPAFAISECCYCAEDPGLDIAVLRISDGGGALPPPLKLDFEPESVGRFLEQNGGRQFQGSEVYIVGHPYRPWSSRASTVVFGVADGSKRWSPGMVTSVNENASTLEHDCSTLGGNSGSCVFAAGTHKVVGLHLGGMGVDPLTERASANIALDFSRIRAQRTAEILKKGIV